jgi:hypothetical protein
MAWVAVVRKLAVIRHRMRSDVSEFRGKLDGDRAKTNAKRQARCRSRRMMGLRPETKQQQSRLTDRRSFPKRWKEFHYGKALLLILLQSDVKGEQAILCCVAWKIVAGLGVQTHCWRGCAKQRRFNHVLQSAQ